MTTAPPRTRLRLGTRKSALARWQTRHVAEMIERTDPSVSCEAIEFTTRGDRDLETPIPDIGGKGVFTHELEAALRGNAIDAAVHALKDLPVDAPAGVVVAAICARDDPRDVLISRRHSSLDRLPRGARVGTSSVRRRAQLLAVRPDLDVVPLRGNVDTRVRRARAEDYDAIVIAAAGVHRLALTEHVREYLDPEIVLPAPAQGALGIQSRPSDQPVRAILTAIDDARSRAEVTAERSFLAGLGGGCSAPVAALARVEGMQLYLTGAVFSPDGSRAIRVSREGDPDAAGDVGDAAAQDALAQGAAECTA